MQKVLYFIERLVSVIINEYLRIFEQAKRFCFVGIENLRGLEESCLLEVSLDVCWEWRARRRSLPSYE